MGKPTAEPHRPHLQLRAEQAGSCSPPQPSACHHQPPVWRGGERKGAGYGRLAWRTNKSNKQDGRTARPLHPAPVTVSEGETPRPAARLVAGRAKPCGPRQTRLRHPTHRHRLPQQTTTPRESGPTGKAVIRVRDAGTGGDRMFRGVFVRRSMLW